MYFVLRPLPWYPKGVAWYTTCPRQALRKHPQMRKLQQWLVKYSESGDLWRQEAVSMIPPLVLDVQPHHLVRGTTRGQLCVCVYKLTRALCRF